MFPNMLSQLLYHLLWHPFFFSFFKSLHNTLVATQLIAVLYQGARSLLKLIGTSQHKSSDPPSLKTVSLFFFFFTFSLQTSVKYLSMRNGPIHGLVHAISYEIFCPNFKNLSPCFLARMSLILLL